MVHLLFTMFYLAIKLAQLSKGWIQCEDIYHVVTIFELLISI